MRLLLTLLLAAQLSIVCAAAQAEVSTTPLTGFINEAGQCLVMLAQIDDRPVVIVLLNSFGKYTRVADAKRIRQWMETQRPRSLARLDSQRR